MGKETTFDKAKYDQEYNKRFMVRKQIAFNKTKPEDMEILDWLERQPNMSEYIKTLVRQDMTD